MGSTNGPQQCGEIYIYIYIYLEAITELAKLLNHVESKLTWPAHIYHNLIVLMGKPAGGTRPIVLMPMVDKNKETTNRCLGSGLGGPMGCCR